MLDIFSCVVQAHPLGRPGTAAGLHLRPLATGGGEHELYPMALALAALVAVFVKHQMRKAAHA